MGNSLAIDINDAALYCLYTLQKDQKTYLSASKFVQAGTIELNGHKFHSLKLALHLLQNLETKYADEKEPIKKFIDQFLEPAAENNEIQVTGYGFDVYNDIITSFIGSFVKNYTFKKFKQIKYYSFGLKYLINETKDWFYTLKPLEITLLNQELNELKGLELDKKYVDHEELKKPFLVVNIKSGVSYYKVESDGKVERLSGSIMGESTFSSLIKLLTSYKSLEESVEDCYKGDNRSVDMTVDDIYGGSYENLRLAKDVIASSFGKARYIEKGDAKDRDIARSVVTMICINIAQLASMTSDLEKLDKIIVLGGMFSQEVFQQLLGSFINFWSKKQKEAIFPEYSEYMAVLGFMLANSNKE